MNHSYKPHGSGGANPPRPTGIIQVYGQLNLKLNKEAI